MKKLQVLQDKACPSKQLDAEYLKNMLSGKEKKYYEAVINNSPVAIVVINQDFIIREWNPAAEKLFGYTSAEAIGKNIDRLITNEEIHSEAVSF